MPLSFSPRGMCILRDGHLLVGTYDNKVYRLRLDASHTDIVKQEVWLEHGPGLDLEQPQHVACNDTVVAVSCRYSHCVHVFNYSGAVLYNLGRPGLGGSREGQLYQPQGVCVDQSGKVFIADYGNNRVMVVAAGGHILCSLQTEDGPRSVTLHQDKLVVGRDDSRIITYNLKQLQ